MRHEVHLNIEILSPYYVMKIWGGDKLSKIKQLSNLSEPLGESWEVSRLNEGPSQTKSKGLNELVSEDELPYLIKFIDTSDNLSVQVHPDDEYAKKNENSKGKSECWLILDATPGSGIYLGFKPGVKKGDFEKAIKSGDELTKFLKFFPVKRGNFFYVPSGTVHAIGSGVLLAEVQQSSGITYRVWDWNRVDDKGVGRELHVKQAMDVLNFNEEDNTDETFLYLEDVFSNDEKKLIEHDDFIATIYSLKAGEEIQIDSEKNRKRSVVCLQGDIRLTEEHGQKEYSSSIIMDKEAFKISANIDSQVLVVR